jgi:hypothetical protein
MGAGQPVIGFELSACEYLARLSESSLYALWCRAFSFKITYSDDYYMIVYACLSILTLECSLIAAAQGLLSQLVICVLK